MIEINISTYVFVILLCLWAVPFLISEFRSFKDTGKAIDKTLSEIPKEDAQRLFSVQHFGYVLLILLAIVIGIGAVVVLVESMISSG